MKKLKSKNSKTLLQTEVILMVYCSKCGKQNENDVEFCADCGVALNPERSGQKRDFQDKRKKDECFGQSGDGDKCFGLPGGGAIFGLFIGIIIIIVGLQQVFGLNIDVGPFAIIIVGLLFAAGAIYGLTHRKR